MSLLRFASIAVRSHSTVRHIAPLCARPAAAVAWLAAPCAVRPFAPSRSASHKAPKGPTKIVGHELQVALGALEGWQKVTHTRNALHSRRGDAERPLMR